MKGKRKFIAAACALAMTLCAGCQPTPETEAVTSKNDGAFAAALENTADEAEAAAEAETYTGSFASTDGSISCTVALDVPDGGAALPVLRVTPEAISSETAERIARAVVGGDAEFHEYSRQMTKTELEAEILSLKQYISDRDALLDFYKGFPESYVDEVIAEYEAEIAGYEAEYDSAPETLETAVYDFAYHPFSYYDPYAGDSDGGEWIWGKAESGGHTWEVQGCRMESGDLKIYNLSVTMAGSEALCWEREDEMTDEVIAEAVSRAEALIDAMDIGGWAVTSYTVLEPGEPFGSGYSLLVRASPSYNGFAMTEHPVVQNDTEAYIADYDDASLSFRFAGGELVSFDYDSPLTVVEQVNDNVQTLSFDEIMDSFQTYMSLRDASFYVLNSIDNCSFVEAGTAEITVDSAVLGLSRVRVQGSDTDYYLVPTYTFYGSVAMYDGTGSPVATCTMSYPDDAISYEPMYVELAVINAVDGSVVDTAQGY